MKTALRLASISVFWVVCCVIFGITQVEAACEVADVNEGPPLIVQFRVQENGGSIFGLQAIRIVQAINATVDIPNFLIGTPNTIFVTATRSNPNLNFSVVLESTNTIGGTSTCSFSRSPIPENEPPVCSLSSENPGPPLSVVFSVRDNDDGLATIDVLEAYNANVNVPGFSVGDTGPILVTAIRINAYDEIRIVLSASDTEGASSECNLFRAPAEDITPPDCRIASTAPGPPSQVLFEVQDGESGLATISVEDAQNANVTISSFEPGTTDPVEVTATQINTNLPFTVILESTNLQNQSSICRYPLISYDINRPEFDAVGDDSQNFFQDPLMGRIIEFSRDRFNAPINEDSNFSTIEYFYNNSGGVVPDPCYTNGSDTYLSALTTSFAEATYEWEIVLQMQPANDILLTTHGCVLSSGAENILEDGRQTGVYRTPWAPNELVFLSDANPTITVTALPGPNAEQGFPPGGFALDARKLPGLDIVVLDEAPMPIQAFISQGLLMINPKQGASNSAGDTMYTINSGDRIRVTIHIPPNNTADIRFGQDAVLLRYLGIVGTEITAAN